MTSPAAEIELPTRPRWLLVIVDTSHDGDGVLAAVRARTPGVAATIAPADWPATEGLGRGSDRHEPDVVISMSEATSWRTIALLSSLRRRLVHEDITVLVVTDVAEELLPVHLTDFPGLSRICLDDDIAAAVDRLLAR